MFKPLYEPVQQAGEIDIMPIDLIEFNSQGRLLIIGSSQQIASVSPHLSNLSLNSTTQTPLKISGWLGAFKVELASHESITVDLVLDLSEQSVMTTKVLPLGYFAPQDNAQALVEALQQLPDLTGTFDKPKYFNYQASICAHSQRQLQGCSHCIDACPAEAIISAGDHVQVNLSLCQGCGSCTAVCPSGAMTYALPTLDVSLNRLRTMLQAYFDLANTPPQLLIYDLAQGQTLLDVMGEQLADNVISFSIEEIGALAMPFYLATLAYGVAGITVWDAGSHSDHDWQELQQEINKTNQLLTGLAYQDDLVTFCADTKISTLGEYVQSHTIMPKIERASFAGLDDKRRMITIALDHLHQRAPKPVEVLTLSADAAFGIVKVDTSNCTLCHSCVSVCPMGALLDGGEQPQLNFIEDRCVQCGLCETACPEKVINLIPQYTFDRQQARKIKVLHQEAIFHCISCNKGFAAQKMIDTMMIKLKDHALFQGDALNRLKMCEDCRVKAIFKDSQ